MDFVGELRYPTGNISSSKEYIKLINKKLSKSHVTIYFLRTYVKGLPIPSLRPKLLRSEPSPVCPWDIRLVNLNLVVALHRVRKCECGRV
jgi:hypothetical protein